jgi:hypothetical protein
MSLRNVRNYDINPFEIDGFDIVNRAVKMNREVDVDEDTGEQITEVYYGREHVWEDRAVYVKEFVGIDVSVLSNLSVTARNMIDYIKRRLKPMNDKFVMEEKDFL